MARNGTGSVVDKRQGNHHTTDELARSAHQAVDMIAESAVQAAEKIRAARASAQEKFRSSKALAREKTTAASENLRQYVVENPMTALGLALAAGVILSALMRRPGESDPGD